MKHLFFLFLTLTFLSSCLAADDPVASFERGLEKLKQSNFFSEGAKIKYDVKKSDSLVTPILGIIRATTGTIAGSVHEYHFSYRGGKWVYDTDLFVFWTESTGPPDLSPFPVSQENRKKVESCFQ